KARSAMVYPAVVSGMAVLISLIMMIKVVPVFKGMFADFGAKLPLPTTILITISDFLIASFWVWLGALIGGIMLIKQFLASEKGTIWFDGFKLNMPIFGQITRKVAISKFSRTLSTLVKSGVPILNALEIVSKTSGNRVIEDAVDKVRASIREGESISAPLIKTKVFPPLVVRMIGVGEQTGQLEKMLNKIADFYDDQVEAAVTSLTSLIEPLIIAFLGIVIGGIVICMFMPIFKLSTIIQG
ncbi:MAG: type II secretion system F family protein, partial [Candidatus Omnitrophota bacterium]